VSELSAEELTHRMKEVGVRQRYLAIHSRVSQTTLSGWQLGLRRPTAENARKVEDTLRWMEQMKEQAGGLPLNFNMSNAKLIRKARKQLRDRGRDKPPAKIDQGHGGAEYTDLWCKGNGLTPHELSLMEQLKAGVLSRELVSAPCQRWNRGFMKAIEDELAAKSFAEYAAGFGSRNEAIVTLANAAFAALLKDAGRSKVLEYMRGLTLTGELKSSPVDIDQN
jgi:hypothetical protein